MPPKITPHHARLEALFEVSRALNSSLELREALVIVIDAAIRLTGAERGFLMLVDEAAGQFQFQVARNARLESIDESAFEVSRTVVQEVAETGAPVVTLNAQKDPRFGGKTSVVNYYLRSIMAVPLRARGRLLGVLYVDSKTRDMEFRQGDLDLLTTFADQAATALVNAQLYEAQRQDANLRRLLLEVADAAQAANDVLDLAHRLAQQLPAWMQCDRCALFLTEAETGGLRLVSAAPDTVRQILIQPVGEPAGAWPFQARLRASPGPLQFTLSELIEALPAEWLSRLALQGDVLAVPLRAETQLLGVLAVDNALAPRPFTPVGLALAEMLGPQLAAAIQRLQLFETARRQLSELLILNAAAQAASQAASLDELTAQVMEVLNPVFGTQGLGVLLIDETAGGLRLHRSFDPEASPEIVIPLARGIAGAVVASGRPIRLGDVTQDPRYLALNPATRSELCVPLRAGERVIGVLNVESPQAHAFSAADERLLVTVAGQLATAIAKQRLLETERQQRELAEALSAVGLELTLETELEVMLDRLLGHIARVVPFDAACVLLVEGDMTRTAGLRGYHRFGLDVDAYVRRQQLAISATTNLRQMAESGLPLVITDVRQNTGWVQTPALPHLHAWVGAPVMVGTRCLAFLSLDKMEGNFYRAEHAQRLAAFAGYAGLALQNVRLLQSAERRAAELDAVRTASLSLTSSLDVREVLQAVLRGTLALLPGAHDARIFFYQAERLEFGAALRADGRPDAAPPPRPRGLTREVAITGELRVVPDIRTHPLFIDAPHEWRGALIGLPLKIGARVVGVMNVAYPEPRAIGEAELRILRLLGEQAAAAIENARLFAATRRQVDELTMLHAVAVASSESISLDMLLERITDLVGGALNARYYGVWLVDGTGLLLRPHTSYRGARQAAVLMGEGLIGRAASAGLPQHAPDVAAEPAYQAVHSGVRSQMCMPLKIDAQVAGVIDLESDRREAFTEADQRLLATVAGQLSIAIAKTRLLEAER
ncbi:MAG: GAF domain-containing protein, partial [Anaerolineales bacterium]|nr:GAF domain-containing protein [Anaerolineales bacterium]